MNRTGFRQLTKRWFQVQQQTWCNPFWLGQSFTLLAHEIILNPNPKSKVADLISIIITLPNLLSIYA